MTTPTRHVLRTVVQVLVAVCLAIPSALALVPIPSKYDGAVALVVGIGAALVVIVTAVQNALEARAGVALFRSPNAVGSLAPPNDPGPTSSPTRSTGYPRGPP